MRPPKTFRALVKKGTSDRSVIIGAPEGFDLCDCLKVANEIKVAIAFGHVSGWNLVSDAIRESRADSVQILLGTAFLQTEPALLFELANLSKSMLSLHVKLANPQTTFHPKVWISKVPNGSVGIVGSGNLSDGGLVRNAECSLYTDIAEDVRALEDWFAYHWSVGSTLQSSLDEYAKRHDQVKQERQFSDEKIRQAENQFAEREAKLQKLSAITEAKHFWASTEGQEEVTTRKNGLLQMRITLKFPRFDFVGDDWKQFLQITEFGTIRQGHTDKTIAALPALRRALMVGLDDGLWGLDLLIAVPGVGRNIATKLMAMFDSNKFVVLNSPVESALCVFGISIEEFGTLNSQTYQTFIKHVRPFWEESDALGLDRASALDAFFYKYRGTDND